MEPDYRSIAQAAQDCYGAWGETYDNAMAANAFVTAFDPQTVLGLLNQIDALTDALTDRTRELVTLENAAHDVVNEWGTRDEEWIRPTFDGAIDRLRAALEFGRTSHE